STSFDLCSEYGTDFSCELDSGICNVAPDAGPDGGTEDAGIDAGADAGDGGALDSGLPGDAGAVPAPDGGGAPADGGTLNVRSAVCNCTQGAGRPDLLWWALGLVLL